MYVLYPSTAHTCMWQWTCPYVQMYTICTCVNIYTCMYICTIMHRYAYPFFGSPYPVVVQPPVPLLPGTEQTFAASCCAFTFATTKSQLERQFHIQPLSVEVWATRKAGDDNLVGIAKVCEHTCSVYLISNS